MFKKVFIANRGEIALRVIRSCKELGLRTVIGFSEADKESLPVKLADEKICIGPPPASDSYLNIPAVISAIELTGCDAVHPGYGFLSENIQFVEICEASRIVFIGPLAENIKMMGDKSLARRTAKINKIPVIPGYEEHNCKEARMQKNWLPGYHAKAKRRKGHDRLITPRSSRSLGTPARKSKSLLSGTAPYLKSRTSQAEIQVIEIRGATWFVLERDCSQRRYQKPDESSFPRASESSGRRFHRLP